MTVIDSPQNPRVRAAAALRDRRDRERAGRTLIDGAREILRAIQADIAIDTLFVRADDCRSADCFEVLHEARRRGIVRQDVGPRAFAKLAFGERAEGVVAVAVPPRASLDDLRLPAEPLIVVLEGVEKPGNLGAVLRSADGAGADALIVAGGGTDLFNPNAIRASVGTIFHIPVATARPEELLPWLRDRGLRIVAARVDGSRPYTAADLSGPLALVLGSEAEGLTPTWAGPDVEPVALPMLGIADSLNVSVAAAVLLYEARRQRDASRARPRRGEGAPARASRP